MFLTTISFLYFRLEPLNDLEINNRTVPVEDIIHKRAILVLCDELVSRKSKSVGAWKWRGFSPGAATRHSHSASVQGRAAAEGFSPTSPRAHWSGPEDCSNRGGKKNP